MPEQDDDENNNKKKHIKKVSPDFLHSIQSQDQRNYLKDNINNNVKKSKNK